MKLNGNIVFEVERFKYIEFVLQNNDIFEEDMKHRIVVIDSVGG